MRERIALLNGKVEILSGPQQGTTVQVRVPIGSGRIPAAALGATELEKQHAR
jgi:signal transduction histidine kinase